MHKVYRLILDEGGISDARDFTVLADAYQEYERAERRDGVFSAEIVELHSDGYERRLAHFQYDGRVGLQHP